METVRNIIIAAFLIIASVGIIIFVISIFYLIFAVFHFKKDFIDTMEPVPFDKSNIPYRLDLAGGWLDQPWVSSIYPGPVITLCIEPDKEFNLRSGLASSTRETAIKLWGKEIPEGDPSVNATWLFEIDNPPEKMYLSGSQDSYGIVFPGVNSFLYNGKKLPCKVESIRENHILDWLESIITLVPLSSRPDDYNVMEGIHLEKDFISDLSHDSAMVWKSIQDKYLFGLCLWANDSFEVQVKIFPNMMTQEISEKIKQLKKESTGVPIGIKITGAGGGGYLIVFGGKGVKGLKIKIRR